MYALNPCECANFSRDDLEEGFFLSGGGDYLFSEKTSAVGGD